MKALIAAAKRGVKITIITVGASKDSALSEKFFAPRNRYNYSYLLSKLSTKDKENVQVYEYSQPGMGLHKKVMIVDDHIFSGSSNMGYKSLVLSGDHEMNFEAQSEDLVKEAMQIVQEDIEKSIKISKFVKITARVRVQAIFHSIGSRIWG